MLVIRRDTGGLVGQLGGPGSQLSDPSGLATDAGGNLFVANRDSGGNYEVWVYAPGQVIPSYSLYDPDSPVRVAVSADGSVFVSNYAYPSIMVYAKGSHTPTSELLDIRASSGLGIAVDAHNNVYWGITTAGGNRIDKFAHGTTKPIDLGIALPDTPTSLAFDRSGDLVIAQPDVPAVDIYELPNTLSQQIVQTGCPGDIAVTTRLTQIFVVNPCSPSSIVDVYTYPGGQFIKAFTPGGYFQPRAVAVYPK